LENFHAAERYCRITNRRIDHYSLYPERLKGHLYGWITTMQREIRWLLGDVKECVHDLPRRVHVTSGATEDRARRRALPPLKVTGRISCPPSTLRYVDPLLMYFGVERHVWRHRPVVTNRVEFVPKNWKTHRGIAAEPTHSLPLQLAAGSFISDRLLRWGVTLRDQTRNQNLAREGSVNGGYATIDMSMASDTLSINTVALLLPDDWFVFLQDLRSSYGRVSGESLRYAKFSSMGNGFTFPLETLIFTAACRAVGSQSYSVYGDDIIVETSAVEDLLVLLRFLGFKINTEKSYVDPECRFRESCGADWYDGKWVTPFYLRSGSSNPTRAILSHNLNGLLALAVPGEKLWAHCLELAVSYGLRLVPINSDTMSGLFITAHDAHRLGLLYSTSNSRLFVSEAGLQSLMYDCYGPRSRKRALRGPRSLFLWFLQDQGGFDPSTMEKSHPALRGIGGTQFEPTRQDLAIAKCRETSSFTAKVTYAHTTRVYRPVQIESQLYLGFVAEDYNSLKRTKRLPKR
jgi:hypothetical protein